MEAVVGGRPGFTDAILVEVAAPGGSDCLVEWVWVRILGKGTVRHQLELEQEETQAPEADLWIREHNHGHVVGTSRPHVQTNNNPLALNLQHSATNGSLRLPQPRALHRKHLFSTLLHFRRESTPIATSDCSSGTVLILPLLIHNFFSTLLVFELAATRINPYVVSPLRG